VYVILYHFNHYFGHSSGEGIGVNMDEDCLYGDPEGFHPILLGVSGGGRRKKKGKGERLWKIKHIFYLLS
jgi:hypothetical protein